MSIPYFAGQMEFRAPVSCTIDSTPPTFAGIATVTFQLDGSAVVTWAAATSTKTPVRYEIYVSPGSVSAAALFVTANRVAFAPGALLAWRIFVLRDQVTYFMPGASYTFGIRAVDSQNYADTNTVILTATALYPNYGTLAAAVWDQLAAAHVIAGSFGLFLDTTVSSRAPASTAVSNVDYTTARAAKIDNLDTTISSRAPAATALSTAIWTNTRAGNLDNIDATITSRAAAATALSTAVWTNGRAANLDNLDVAVSTRAPASTALSTAVWTNGRASNLDNLDVAVSTRATQASVSAIPTNPLLTTDVRLNTLDVNISTRAPASTALSTAIWTNTRAGNLDNLDVAVSTRAAAATALSTAVWTNGRAANLDFLDVAVSSRSSASALAAVDADVNAVGTIVTAIKVKTDQLNFTGTDVNAHTNNITPINVQQIVDGVWNEPTSAHTTPGTFGENAQTPAINPQQVADAVWDEPIANHLTPGSTGKKLNDGASGSGGGGGSGCVELMGVLEVQELQGALDDSEIAGTISQVIELNC